MKDYFKVLVQITILLFSDVSSGNSAESVLLKNKYGWQMSVPKCWQTLLTEGVKAEENPLVQFVSTAECKDKYPEDTALGISIPLMNPPTSIAEFISMNKKLMSYKNTEYYVKDFFLNPEKVKAVVSKGRRLNENDAIFLEAKMVCDERNLYFRISYLLKPEDQKKELKQLEIDPSVMKVVETFKCTEK